MSVFEELKRRNVIRVGIAYVVIAWLLAQVAELGLDAFNAPDWAMQTILLALALGLPLALLFAWAFELTPEGLKREKDVDRSKSVTARTGRKLDLVIIGMLVLALGYFIWESRFADRPAQPAVAEQAEAGAEEAAPTAGVNERSLAVLPFVPLSANEDDVYFGRGIAEELLNALAKFPDLKVAARTSAFSFGSKDVDLREVGQVLGVAHVLEGSVRSAGDKVRVTAQLIRAADGFHLWSERYDRDMKDIFVVQDEIVSQISRALQIRLGVGAGTGRSAAAQVDPQAYQSYLRGLDMWGLRSKDENRAGAIRAFRVAAEQDPGFADGWAAYGLSLVLSGTRFSGMPKDQHLAAAREALQNALAIDPDNYRAITGSGYLSTSRDLDVERATALAERAVDIAPNAALSRYLQGDVLMLRGKHAEAFQAYDRSVALDPLNLVIHRVRFEQECTLGKFTEVPEELANCQKCSEIEQLLIARAQYMSMRRAGTDDDVRRSAQVVHALATDISRNKPEILLDDFNAPDATLVIGTSDPDFVEWLLGGPRPPPERLQWLEEVDLDRASFSEAPMLARVGETDLALAVLDNAYRHQLFYLPNILDAPGRDAWPEAFRRDPRFHAFWQGPGMPGLAEILRKNGRTNGLPLPPEEST